jgi:cell division protein FtsL
MMSFSNDELKKLAVPLALLVALLAAGAALIWWSQREQRLATQSLAAARAERTQANERLARIAEEEKEVKDKLEVYQRLKSLRILGEEQRLEWADAMTRIRRERELLDLRYSVGRQQPIVSVAGKPNSVDFFASTMRVDIALLHEGDLFTFLRDLRESGNAYYAVKRCALGRTGAVATGVSLTPRLRANCDIDLITIIDRAAKK